MNWSKSRKIFLTGWRVIKALPPAKRRPRIFSSMLAVLAGLFMGPNAQAKKNTGDWRVVENLQPGTHVIVKAQQKYSCTVEGATEEELTCWVHVRRSFRMVSIKIPRAEIREVRTLPNQARDAWIGAGIGGAAGAVAAGTNSRTYPGVNAFFGGLAGAAGGALVGATVPIFQYLIQHGKTIYKQ
jgi:hypothetical protein